MAALQFQALGTHWIIEWLDGNLRPGDIRAINGYVSQFETDYSRFRPDSFVSKLNDTKRLADPPADMVRMLQFAIDTYRQTGGLFNISVGGRLEQLGYGRQPDISAHIVGDLADKIHITPNLIIIDAAVRLDFGGFGKGWLIDELGSLLAERGVLHFLINGGGDILVNSDRPIDLAIEHPFDPSLGIGTVTISNGSLATSSARKRAWTGVDGQPAHHIIRPDTGKSDSLLASAHVYAKDALTADTLGTVMLLANESERQRIANAYGATVLLIDDQLHFHQDVNFPGKMHQN